MLLKLLLSLMHQFDTILPFFYPVVLRIKNGAKISGKEIKMNIDAKRRNKVKKLKNAVKINSNYNLKKASIQFHTCYKPPPVSICERASAKTLAVHSEAAGQGQVENRVLSIHSVNISSQTMCKTAKTKYEKSIKAAKNKLDCVIASPVLTSLIKISRRSSLNCAVEDGIDTMWMVLSTSCRSFLVTNEN